MKAPLPLPIETAKTLRDRARFCRDMKKREPRLASAWQTEADQARWEVMQLRMEFPRARRRAMKARAERVAAQPRVPSDLASSMLTEASQ